MTFSQLCTSPQFTEVPRGTPFQIYDMRTKPMYHDESVKLSIRKKMSDAALQGKSTYPMNELASNRKRISKKYILIRKFHFIRNVLNSFSFIIISAAKEKLELQYCYFDI